MKRKRIWIAAVLAALAAAGFLFRPKADSGGMQFKEVPVRPGRIERSVSVPAVVQPRSRLEMKPPVAGRIDRILVAEGQEVRAGDTLALMSSTERAALLDSAQSGGGKDMKYWEEIYKPISILAPIDATVIVSTMQPGQTVTQADPIVVLSDRLIVQAQVDETDIGKVRAGQRAVVTLDAYPDVRVEAAVEHIYHESKVVNNVTIYQVDIQPETIPDVYRSGMSAGVRIVQQSKDGVLVVPAEAVKQDKSPQESFVYVSRGKGRKPERRVVETGLSDETAVEIVSGLEAGETLAIPSAKYVPSKGARQGSNPFLPQRRRSGEKDGGPAR